MMRKDDLLISVIVPVYNTCQYVRRCIESITNQTYKNLEIICVDDGSTDGSSKILDELAGSDDRVRVFHNENKGVTSARNFALKVATGDFIGFVDSDDYIDSNYYKYLIGAFDDDRVDMVTCSYYFDKMGHISKAVNLKHPPTEPLPTIEFLKYMYERDIYNGVGSYLWTRLIRKEIIKNEDGSLKVKFQKEYGGADDIVFVAQASLKSRYIRYINMPLYYYFQRDGSIVHDDKKRLETLDWIKAYERILEEYDCKGIHKDIIDLIKRMYVYRCGKLLETAIHVKDEEKIYILKGKIKKELLPYMRTNLEHLDRIYWIVGLLICK